MQIPSKGKDVLLVISLFLIPMIYNFSEHRKNRASFTIWTFRLPYYYSGFGKLRTKGGLPVLSGGEWTIDAYSVWKPDPLSVPIYQLSCHLTCCWETPGERVPCELFQVWGHRRQQWGPDTSAIQTHISLRIDCGRFSQNVFSHVACLTLNIVKKLKADFWGTIYKSSYKKETTKKYYPSTYNSSSEQG